MFALDLSPNVTDNLLKLTKKQVYLMEITTHIPHIAHRTPHTAHRTNWLKTPNCFCIGFFVLMFSSLNAQTICVVTDDNQQRNSNDYGCIDYGYGFGDAYSHSADPAVLAAYPPVSFNVYFWGINRDDGTSADPLTKEQVLKAVDMLNAAYSEMNICFNLVGYDYINETDVYEPKQAVLQQYVMTNNHRKTNALNIYASRQLYYKAIDKPIRTLKGIFWSNNFPELGDGIAISMDFINRGLLIHEMGHSLGLSHIFGGCEHVTRDPTDPNYNATCSGDYVTDTNAAPDFTAPAVNPINGNCEYTGNAEDCLGTPYIINENETKNYMAYTFDSCREIFTTGQGIRVRETIDTGYVSVLSNQSYDLVIRNSLADVGAEPDIHTEKKHWNSPDIWLIHGIPTKKPVIRNTSTAYVRITNKGCIASSGNNKLVLYWSRSNVYRNDKGYWTELGESIDILEVPVIEPGQDTIFEFQCETPELSEYSGTINGKTWHLSLVAKIDPMRAPLPAISSFISANNVLENSNLSVKNVSPVIVKFPQIELLLRGTIEGISPNPAFNQVAINYEIGNSNSAYLKITKANSTISNNYDLDEVQSQIALDVSNYATGIYIVSLICNGQVTDSKNLIIQ